MWFVVATSIYFFKAKPGRYIIEITNSHAKLSLTNSKLSVQVVCGSFATQTSNITKQQKWYTNASVGLSQTTGIVVSITSEQSSAHVPFHVRVFQSIDQISCYNNVVFCQMFERQGYLGISEPNVTFEYKVDVGVYYVVAETKMKSSFSLRYLYDDSIDELHPSVSSVAPLRSRDIIVRSADAHKNIRFEIKNNNKSDSFFNVKVLQAVSTAGINFQYQHKFRNGAAGGYRTQRNDKPNAKHDRGCICTK